MKTGIRIQNIKKNYEEDLLYEKPENSDLNRTTQMNNMANQGQVMLNMNGQALGLCFRQGSATLVHNTEVGLPVFITSMLLQSNTCKVQYELLFSLQYAYPTKITLKERK